MTIDAQRSYKSMKSLEYVSLDDSLLGKTSF